MSSRKSTTRSSLAAGSFRRRRMMLNDLISGEAYQHNNEEEHTLQTEQSTESTDGTELTNWMSSLSCKPLATKETLINVEPEPNGDNDLFGQLVELSETEQTNNRKQQNSLEGQLSKFTEIVQSFDSPDVQREVFSALVNAFEKEEALKNKSKTDSPSLKN